MKTTQIDKWEILNKIEQNGIAVYNDNASKSFVLESIGDVIDRMKEYAGYIGDDEIGELPNKITESENCNGSWYCNAYKATKEWGENIFLFNSIVKYWAEQMGEDEPTIKIDYYGMEKEHCKHMIIFYEIIARAIIDLLGGAK